MEPKMNSTDSLIKQISTIFNEIFAKNGLTEELPDCEILIKHLHQLNIKSCYDYADENIPEDRYNKFISCCFVTMSQFHMNPLSVLLNEKDRMFDRPGLIDLILPLANDLDFDSLNLILKNKLPRNKLSIGIEIMLNSISLILPIYLKLTLEKLEIFIEAGDEIRLHESLKSDNKEEIIKWMRDNVPPDIEEKFLNFLNHIKIRIFKTDAILSVDLILDTQKPIKADVINNETFIVIKDESLNHSTKNLINSDLQQQHKYIPFYGHRLIQPVVERRDSYHKIPQLPINDSFSHPLYRINGYLISELQNLIKKEYDENLTKILIPEDLSQPENSSFSEEKLIKNIMAQNADTNFIIFFTGLKPYLFDLIKRRRAFTEIKLAFILSDTKILQQLDMKDLLCYLIESSSSLTKVVLGVMIQKQNYPIPFHYKFNNQIFRTNFDLLTDLMFDNDRILISFVATKDAKNRGQTELIYALHNMDTNCIISEHNSFSHRGSVDILIDEVPHKVMIADVHDYDDTKELKYVLNMLFHFSSLVVISISIQDAEMYLNYMKESSLDISSNNIVKNHQISLFSLKILIKVKIMIF